MDIHNAPTYIKGQEVPIVKKHLYLLNLGFLNMNAERFLK